MRGAPLDEEIVASRDPKSPLDPIGIGAAGMRVLAVALTAAFVPARRAVRIDLVTTLYYE